MRRSRLRQAALKEGLGSLSITPRRSALVSPLIVRTTQIPLLGVSGGMALLVGSGPGIAQRLMINDVIERRERMDIKRNGIPRPSTKGP